MDIKSLDKSKIASLNKRGQKSKTPKAQKPKETYANPFANQIKCLLGGVSVGYAITIIVFIAYAIMLTYTNLSDKGMDVVVILTTVISVMIAGFDTTKNAEKGGLIWGVFAGIVYCVILIFISTLIDGKLILDAETFITILVAMASGGIGGIFGINKKN